VLILLLIVILSATVAEWFKRCAKSKTDALELVNQPTESRTIVSKWIAPPPKAKAKIETGKASYYSDYLTGKKTASGEPYWPHVYTAAHRTLPLGTLVKVTCKETNQSVIVKINDRGPFIKRRIIDLSKSAFQSINSSRKGEITVEVEVLTGLIPVK
jgi:rare lipoprotein A